MKIKGATTVLRKQLDFLGFDTISELMAYIEKVGITSQPLRVAEAYKVYNDYHREEEEYLNYLESKHGCFRLANGKSIFAKNS